MEAERLDHYRQILLEQLRQHSELARGNQSDALDILSADVATGKKSVVYVLRMKTTNVANDPWAHLGYKWDVQFTLAGVNYYVQRSMSMTATGTVSYSDVFAAGQTQTSLPASAVKPRRPTQH